MKKLSINIPTYNRDVFLKKNISIIIDQLRTDDLVNDVEINVSDNASTDTTQEIVRELIDKNPDISITYHRNEVNEGPDVNFIKAMHMATGEYSILFGDDDFFEPQAIRNIFGMFIKYTETAIFVSNRISVNSNDEFVRKQAFLREDVESQTFDFSHKNDIRAYFSLVRDLGGVLTFISSVIYKTSILRDVGEYNSDCNGTCYSFLFYFWTSLARGKQLTYLNEYFVRATTIGVTNNNYGIGLKRLLVDTEGLSRIASIVFYDESIDIKDAFLSAVRKSIPLKRITPEIYAASNNNLNRLNDSLIKCGWDCDFVNHLLYLTSFRVGLKTVIKNLIPFMGKRIRI